MKIAIIPARGGSKRIPRKNIRLFHDRPMLAWSVRTAVDSGLFDEVMVSTDDAEIAQTARDWGACVPFLRSPEAANDTAPTGQVMREVLTQYIAAGQPVDLACCIYATAPFLQADDLRRGLRMLQTQACEYAFSITEYAFPIQRALRLDANERVAMFHPEYAMTRSQDLEHAYHDAAQFYWGRTSAWLDQKPVFAAHSVPVVLPRHRVMDIDTPQDWEQAEMMMRVLQLQQGQP